MDACNGSCGCSTGAEARGGLGRREFMGYAAATLAAMALAACSIADTMLSPTTIAATSLKLTDFPALASVGGVATTVVSGVPLAIVRTSSASVSVFSRICPHQGSTINVSGSGFLCPNHGAQFDANGKWIGGQRTSNLVSYPATLDATAGTISLG